MSDVTTILVAVWEVVQNQPVALTRSRWWGDMRIENREIEIWTRLVIDFVDCWLEVFNALDENGYHLHDEIPSGEFVNCF